MTAAFDGLQLRDLVELLTPDEQREPRPVVLRLVAGHRTPPGPPSSPTRRFSFTGTVQAGPDFASTSQEMLNRELGDRS